MYSRFDGAKSYFIASPRRGWQRENRRRTIVRVVCVVIAVAMLGSLIIPAIYAGL